MHPARKSDALAATIALLNELVEELAEQVAAKVADAVASASTGNRRWLDITGAAAHLAMTEQALRSLVKRGEMPVHRLPNGRLRFRSEELDVWARSAADTS